MNNRRQGPLGTILEAGHHTGLLSLQHAACLLYFSFCKESLVPFARLNLSPTFRHPFSLSLRSQQKSAIALWGPKLIYLRGPLQDQKENHLASANFPNHMTIARAHPRASGGACANRGPQSFIFTRITMNSPHFLKKFCPISRMSNLHCFSLPACHLYN